MQDKRSIDGYEEKFFIPIAGQDIVVAENPVAEEPYLICSINYNNPLGIEERRDGAVSADYLEIIRELATRIKALADSLETERAATGLPMQILGAADCLPGSANMDWDGKVIIVKPDALAPEYRRSENQLYQCIGGFGSKANARGNKVYVQELFSGIQCHFQRHQIAGVADPAKLPQWAWEKRPKQSISERLTDAKAEADAYNAAQVRKNAKSKGLEV